jgi:hypothetical protein
MNTPQNDGGAAFPYVKTDECIESCNGMTLRDWFAGQAMQSENIAIAIMVASGKTAVPDNWNYDVAKGAYSIADAMLAQRNRL